MAGGGAGTRLLDPVSQVVAGVRLPAQQCLVPPACKTGRVALVALARLEVSALHDCLCTY